MCQDAASALGFGTLSTAAAPTPGELCPLPTQRAGVPNLQDLMPDDLNIRNKVCNKCDALESTQNHSLYPHSWSVEKLSSTKPVPSARKVRDMSL